MASAAPPRAIPLTYTLTYNNAGTQNATGVVLTENLPAGATFVSAGSTAGWTETAPGSGIFHLTIGALSASVGGTAKFVVHVSTPAATGLASIVNSASIADDGK